MLASAIELAPAASDFSIVALFMNAHPIVKVVMVMLVAASVWSWAVIINKQLQYADLSSRAARFEDDFWAGRSLDDLEAHHGARPGDPMAKVFAAAMREFRRGGEGRSALTGTGLLTLNQRIDRVMGLVVLRECTKAEQGLGVLATVASAAPFIGLFGTVFGIMNAFRSIAASQSSNIAVVAPGIAEALFATALGLIAAVPAMIFYNKFATDSTRYSAKLEGFAEELSAILSHRLQERGA